MMVLSSGSERDFANRKLARASEYKKRPSGNVEETKEKIRAIFRGEEKIRASIKEYKKDK